MMRTTQYAPNALFVFGVASLMLLFVLIERCFAQTNMRIRADSVQNNISCM